MDRVHNTDFSSRPSLEKQLKSLYNLRIEIVVPELAGYLASGSFTPAMSATTKQFHFRSIKVIPLFHFSVIPYSMFYSILCVGVQRTLHDLHTYAHNNVYRCCVCISNVFMSHVKVMLMFMWAWKLASSPGCVREEGGEVVWHPELPRNWIIFTLCH